MTGAEPQLPITTTLAMRGLRAALARADSSQPSPDDLVIALTEVLEWAYIFTLADRHPALEYLRREVPRKQRPIVDALCYARGKAAHRGSLPISAPTFRAAPEFMTWLPLPPPRGSKGQGKRGKRRRGRESPEERASRHYDAILARKPVAASLALAVRAFTAREQHRQSLRRMAATMGAVDLNRRTASPRRATSS
jgi:hypothetical protein